MKFSHPALLLFLICNIAFANDNTNLGFDPKNPPPGLVFEVIEENPAKLPVAIKIVQNRITRLRKQFPDMEFAVVSHGPELFALEKKQAKKFKQLHDNVIQMKNSDIPVHVCETFAGWHAKSAHDFPDYVNVSATGPAQINDYIKLGYMKVLISVD